MAVAAAAVLAKGVLPDLVLFGDFCEQAPEQTPSTTSHVHRNTKKTQAVIDDSVNLLNKTIAGHGQMSSDSLLRTARCHAGVGFLTELVANAD